MAQTWADYIKVDMEHAPFDIRALDQFMRGLVDGGPTRSGHRIPAVVAEVPAEGVSAEEIRANAWMFKQVLARGVTGINLCHAETPAAIKAFVEACRYPFHSRWCRLTHQARTTIASSDRAGLVGQARSSPRDGAGTATPARKTRPRYGACRSRSTCNTPTCGRSTRTAKLMLGVKIENRRALRNAERSAPVPGIGFAEWGSRDMAWSHGYAGYVDPPYPDDLEAVRVRVFTACTQAGLFFHNAVSRDDVVSRLQARGDDRQSPRRFGGRQDRARPYQAHHARSSRGHPHPLYMVERVRPGPYPSRKWLPAMCRVPPKVVPVVLHVVVGGEDSAHHPAPLPRDSPGPSRLASARITASADQVVPSSSLTISPIPKGGQRRSKTTTIRPSRSRSGHGAR